MAGELDGIKAAILATNGVEQIEFTEPLRALQEAGAEVDVISTGPKFSGAHNDRPGDEFDADLLLEEADANDYDALVLPGGTMNADRLRTEPKASDFVRSFFEDEKPVAAICHAPWLLIEADVVGGRHVTAWPSLRTDLINAGALWVDRATVRSGNLLTSRKPDDLPAFCAEMTRMFGESREASDEALPVRASAGSVVDRRSPLH